MAQIEGTILLKSDEDARRIMDGMVISPLSPRVLLAICPSGCYLKLVLVTVIDIICGLR